MPEDGCSPKFLATFVGCAALRCGVTLGVNAPVASAWGKEEHSMKAIVRDTYGSRDVLELRNIDKPEIGDHEVLVHVRAAGVDRGVWHVMAGLPYPIRLAGYGLRAPKNPVIGSDVAGVVETVGRDV